MITPLQSMPGTEDEDKFNPASSQPIQGQKRPYLILTLLVLLYLGAALSHACLAPLTTGPDELAHYEYMQFIAEHGRLPLNHQEREQASYKSDQPPLYHLLAALPASLVDPTGPPFLKRVNDHPRRQLIERTRHAWGLYNTEDEKWPYRAEVLRWHVGRWMAILFGAAAVGVTFFIGRDLFRKILVNEDRAYFWPALGAAAIVAFIPRFTLTGSMLNYETTLAFWAALFLWLLWRIAQGPRPDKRLQLQVLLLGLLAGLAITAKLSAVILLPEAAVALWLIGRQQGWPWKKWLGLTALTGAGASAAVSWWFGFILYQFNTVAQDGWWVGLLRPVLAADASDATTNRLLSLLSGGQAGFTAAIENLDAGPPWEWLAVFFRTFWVVRIEQFWPLGLAGLAVALVMCLLATYGLIRAWRGNEAASSFSSPKTSLTPAGEIHRSRRLAISLLLLHLGMPLILPLMRYAVTFSLADTAQGRHVLFLAAPAVAILLVWGIRESTARINNAWFGIQKLGLDIVAVVPGLFLLLWSGVQLWAMTWAYLPPLPVQTRPLIPQQVSHQVNQPLNQYVTLIGYNSQIEAERGVLQLDLIWQAAAISPVDYLTEVSLLDQSGHLQRQWLGYPAEGRYPTRAWDQGDIIRDTVWLPLAGLEPGSYQLELNLVATTQQPSSQPVSQGRDAPLRLATFTLPDPIPSPSEAIQIWQAGRVVTQPELFRYRETIVVTLNSDLADPGSRTVQIVESGPEPEFVFEPERDLGETVLFMVGPDWPGGDYQVQVTVKNPEPDELRQVASEPLIQIIDRWQRQFTPPPINHPVEANFANQVKLLGYDLGARRAEPGGGIPVTLYWQGLDWMGEDYTIFTKLLAADQTVHGGRDRLPQEGYRTLYWAPNEVIVDSFGLPVDLDAPDGIYYLNVGLYQQVGQQAISLPLVENGQPIEATSINIGPIKIGNAPPGSIQETANPQITLNQPFGDGPQLTLLGYDLTGAAGRPLQTSPPGDIQELNLTLYWRSEAVLPVDYTTFVHLRNTAGETMAQKDQPPLNGAYPTSLWDPGQIIADDLSILVPEGLPGGEYEIVIGMYNFQTGQRLMTPDQPANEVRLTRVQLP